MPHNRIAADAWRGARILGVILGTHCTVSSGHLSADAIHDQMIAATVRVLNLDAQGSGSGVFVGGGGYVVTNWHVVDTPQGPPATQLFVVQKLPNGTIMKSAAKVVWAADPARDVAILQLAEPWAKSSPAINMAPERGDEVRAIGFPGISDLLIADSELAQLLEPTLNVGTITRIIGKAEAYDGAAVVVHQAPINKGNSGGPLFDRCGSVVGVNSASMKFEQDQIQGTNLAIHISEVNVGLTQLKLPLRVAGKCDPGAGGSTAAPMMTWVAITLAVALSGFAVTLTLTQRGRAAVQRVSRPLTQLLQGHPGRPAVIPASSAGRVHCLTGEYRGRTIDLGTEPLVFGRDPSLRGLVFLTDEAAAVSKRHCELRFDPARRVFVLTDLGSSNGTFLEDGTRLAAHVPTDLRSGQRFYLGDRTTTLEVVA